MGFLGWLAQNWFNMLQTGGIVASLIFTGVALRDSTQTSRINNLIYLTENHRELWSNILHQPGLSRILEQSVDLAQKPITAREQILALLAIQHLHSAFRAMKNGLVVKPDSLRRDVTEFFSLPIPSSVWSQMKEFQNGDFVAFVDSCLNPA